MNQTVKNILVIAAKNAVNAILVTLPLLKIDPTNFHFHNWSGFDHILESLLSAVIAREALVWGPALLKWSQTSATAIVILILSGLAIGQTTPPPAPQPTAFPTTTVSFNLTPISLPGAKTSVSGAEVDAFLKLTSNISFGETSLISGGYSFIGGRVNYVIPQFSKWLNNTSPTLNGYQFQLGVTGSLGVDRVPTGPGVSASHWGERAGLFLNYAVNGTVGLGMEAQWCNFPGYAQTSYSVAFGPNFHF